MNNRAFTLVETLAVIILLGVIMSIAIPSINNAMDSANKRRIKEDAEMFIILAKEYVETHKDFNGAETTICNKGNTSNCIDGDKLSDTYDTEITICNKGNTSNCIDGDKLSDTYDTGEVTVSGCNYKDNDIYVCDSYFVNLKNNKYIASGKEGSINVNKK